MRLSSPGLSGFTRLRHPQTRADRHRVLVADDDTPFARRLADYLWNHGFECRTTTRISEAKHLVEFWQPDSVFVDLMLPESNALSLCRFIQTRHLKKIPKIIVMSKQTLPQGIETMRRGGADHYLVKPFAFEEAFRAVDDRPETPNPVKDPATIKELHLLNLFLKQAMVDASSRTNLFNLMRMISLKVHALRCSVIHCLNEDTGLVMASNDDESVQGLPIRMESYPEVLEVRRTQRPLLIPNVRTSDIMSGVADRLAPAGYATMALFPLFERNQFYGVLSLRLEQKSKVEMYYIEKFGLVCSQIISLAIGGKPT